jgi:ABC-2 type transport system permease protein
VIEFLRESLRQLYLLILYDIRKIFRYKIFILMRVAWFTVQVGFFAYLITAVVGQRFGAQTTYYHFYLLGAYTSILFTITMFRGYEIAQEFEEGVIEYMLSLPIKRRILAIGRILGGSISSFFLSLPMFLIVIILLGGFEPIAILSAALSAYLFSIGVVGLSISIVFLLKSGDVTDIAFGMMDSLLVRLSTVFYPASILLSFLPYYYVGVSNPLSYLADFLRWIFYPSELGKYLIQDDPAKILFFLLGFSISLTTLATIFIEKRVEGGGWK